MSECSCDEIRGIIKEVVKEQFQENLEKLKETMPAKKIRAKSKWQIFLKECVPKKQALPFKDRIKACSVEWNKCKAEGKNPCHGS